MTERQRQSSLEPPEIAEPQRGGAGGGGAPPTQAKTRGHEGAKRLNAECERRSVEWSDSGTRADSETTARESRNEGRRPEAPLKAGARPWATDSTDRREGEPEGPPKAVWRSRARTRFQRGCRRLFCAGTRGGIALAIRKSLPGVQPGRAAGELFRPLGGQVQLSTRTRHAHAPMRCGGGISRIVAHRSAGARSILRGGGLRN